MTFLWKKRKNGNVEPHKNINSQKNQHANYNKKKTKPQRSKKNKRNHDQPFNMGKHQHIENLMFNIEPFNKI
jgi:hypothetical protein